MKFWNIGTIVLVGVMEVAAGRQFCGADLVNVMQLVCSGRGYNNAFKTVHNTGERRYKRGIVDECCRRGCTWSTLESYCSAPPANVNIKKRSDYTSKWQPESSEAQTKVEKNYKHEMSQKYNTKRKSKISAQNKESSFNRFQSSKSETNSKRVRGRSQQGNKVKRNDLANEKHSRSKLSSILFGINWQSGKMEQIDKAKERVPDRIPIRHRRRKTDATRKSSKEKTNDKAVTAPPYFFGRTMVIS